ncbi:hypothetical protein [Planomonospora algeriensis]
MAEQVAAASTELSTSAASLAASASASVREAESAKEAVGLMEDSSKEIQQVASAQSAAREGIGVIETIGRTVRDMDALAHAIAAAVDGGGGTRGGREAAETGGTGGGGRADSRGLARTAELLRSEVSHFLAVMREG